ncbi:MAG: hypothetical protein LBL27_03010 [Coriobacteriales bacterium]|jgi:hypothetical protein|nr:hypothetical protein [Coriobacteriales bacterium]
MGLKETGVASTHIKAETFDERQGRRAFWFVARDGGFTSVGVVIALLLVIALLFSTAQVYWVNSTAGDIQFAADAGALAAENVVGEYYVLARVADAVVLSLSLFGLLVYGIAIVVSCIPYCQAVGEKLMELGRKVFNARDDCARQAGTALDSLQKALPFLAVASAASTISANDFSPAGTPQYRGLAILVPLEGETTSFPDDDEAQAAGDELEEQNKETSEATDEAAEARADMDEAKREGYEADCGADPNYCMYERAGHLAGLAGTQNPYFSSVELWQFDYAFNRAKSYYQRRLAIEAPANSTLEEQVRSNVRKMFFSYAVEEMGKGYAHTDSDGVLDAYFPLLARNNSEIRETRLYTDSAFPVDSEGYIHGVASCPQISGGITGYGSIAGLEDGWYEACPTCELSINTIGRIASASSSIDNGFEYHYRIVAQAAERYEKASEEYQENTRAAKDSASDALDTFAEALSALDTSRLSPHPPGRNGCVALAIDTSTHEIPGLFSNSLVGGDGSLQPRIALSAAALVDDTARSDDNILASFFEKAKEDVDEGSALRGAFGAFDKILDIWGGALFYYDQGVESLIGGVGDFLRAIPLVNSTPLASWAEGALREAIEAVGLQGVDLDMPKPALVNSIHVLRSSDSAAGGGLASAKEAYSALPGSGSGTLQASTIDGLLLELKERGAQSLESEITIFTISFGDMPGMPQIPIKLALPAAVVEKGKGLLDDALSSLPANMGGGGGGGVWE